MTADSLQSKCDSHCVNDLLYYVDFKRKVSPVNDVVAICDAFYAPDDILEAKKVLFNAIGERDGLRYVNRRGKAGENPSKMNLEDIVNAMIKCDNDGVTLPAFVSANFAKIPQNNEGSVSLNQVLYMIVEMKTQIANLEGKISSSSASPSINVSPALPSSTAAFAATDIIAAAASHTPSDASAATSGAAPTTTTSAATLTTTTSAAVTAPTFSAAAASGSTAAATTSGITAEALSDALRSAVPYANKVANGSGRRYGKQIEQTSESRVKRNHDRNRNVVIGKKPSSGVISFVGVPLTVECYVGRVGLSGTAEQITSHIKSHNVDVVSIEENTTQHRVFKSFKVVIKKTDFDTLNHQDAWPEGIHFRRFRRPRLTNSGPEGDPNIT